MMNCPPGGPRYPRPPWIGLAKMCEELAEVIQVAAKLAVCPNGEYFDGKDLVEWLQEEMADASAILQFVEHQNNLVVDQKRVEEKYRKFCEWFGVGMDAFSADREDVSDDEFIDVRAAMPTAVSDITKPVPITESLQQWMARMADGRDGLQKFPPCNAFTLIYLPQLGTVELQTVDTPPLAPRRAAELFLVTAAKHAAGMEGPVRFAVFAYAGLTLVNQKAFTLGGSIV